MRRGVHKQKRAYLGLIVSKMVIVMLTLLFMIGQEIHLDCSKNRSKKRTRTDFWDYQLTVHNPPKGYVHFPRDTNLLSAYRIAVVGVVTVASGRGQLNSYDIMCKYNYISVYTYMMHTYIKLRLVTWIKLNRFSPIVIINDGRLQ